jgi:hypothetical protein
MRYRLNIPDDRAGELARACRRVRRYNCELQERWRDSKFFKIVFSTTSVRSGKSPSGSFDFGAGA